MSFGPPLFEDSLVDHDCPLHDDTAYDFAALSAYDRKWLEDIACPDLALHEENARLAQLEVADATDRAMRVAIETRVEMLLRRAARIREDMRRTIAREPRPAARVVDLYAV